MLLCSKNKSVSSANIIGTSTFEELGRSFTYYKNNVLKQSQKIMRQIYET